MNKIKLLPPHEAQKIAAGETIERPAHVLKELLENSIDAQASAIAIYIEEAGKKCIRVDDDGCGMSYDDALMCILPHATSKITAVDDLSTIATYGFRGEAMASIAAVSRLCITTKNEESDAAWELRFESGALIEKQQRAANQGTSIEVRDLFYNLPARKKFLKQDETEWNQLQQYVYAIALSNLHIGFKLYHNDKLIFQAPQAATLHDRIAQLWDVATAQQFIAIQAQQEATFGIQGLITSHQAWRYGKHNIFFFVNNRAVRDSELNKALLKGYNDILPPGRFPAAVISLTFDPAVIDVNVHPKKEEVRFAKPGVVTATITRTIQESLRLATQATINIKNEESIVKKSSNTIPNSLAATDTPDAPVHRIIIDDLAETETLQKIFIHKEPSYQSFSNPFINRVNTEQELQQEEYPAPDEVPTESVEALKQTMLIEEPVSNNAANILKGKIIGQIFDTYIIVQTADAVVYVDQHAAHERILYERMKDKVVARESAALLFPLVITLSKQELNALELYEEELAAFGLTGDRVGPQSFAIKTIPLGCPQVDIQELIKECSALIFNEESLNTETIQKKIYEHIHSHLACKKAVKAGDQLSMDAMDRLLNDLMTVEKPFICIHGRPTYWKQGQHELEKLFRR